MNVLLLTSSFPQNETSYEGRFVFQLGNFLYKRGFESLILAPHFPGGKKHEILSDVEVFRFPYFFPNRYERLAYGSGILFNLEKFPSSFFSIIPFMVAEFIWALKIIAKKNIRIIHSHWLLPQGLIGAFIHRFFQIPHVATVHGSDLAILKNHRILIPLCHFIVSNADVVTVNSTFMQQQLLSLVPDSVQKIRIIPMGIDPEKIQQSSFIDIKKRHKTSHIVLSVGRLIDLKGIMYLINAMPEVIRNYPDTMLLIAGSGPEYNKLMQRVQELNLENNVTFLGIIDIEELPSYYHAADVFVLPSINKNGKTEAFGVVLLEAMASGCPVIGSNVGGIPDIIVDGESGFLVPEKNSQIIADRIVQLITDDELRMQFRQNGLIRVRERFLWDTISKNFAEVFELVLTGHKKMDE